MCVLVMSDSLQPHGLQPTRLLCPWDSPGKNTGLGCHSLLQGIFLTRGLNCGLLYRLSHEGSLYILYLCVCVCVCVCVHTQTKANRQQ